MPATDPLSDAVSVFGEATKSKLSNPAATGSPEDQLRAPLETLIQGLASIAGLPDGVVNLVGESSQAHLAARPDYAVVAHSALIGFIEVKAPGKGADPHRFTDPHDKAQWSKLKSLPNLLYTDGNSFSLWRDGELSGSIVRLDGDVETSGRSLKAPGALVPLIGDFLRWSPIPPRTPKQLAQVAARLCRLLRDEVVEQLGLGSEALTSLAADWRSLLFPQATDAEFADGYAQAVTFGLIVARAHAIPLDDGIDHAAKALRKTNSLIGTALGLLTDDDTNREALKTSLDTLTRVLNVVDWETVSKGDGDAWLYFYEDFLGVYDNALRKRTGSYYTPPEVVGAMVRLVDEALCRSDLFDCAGGLASPQVTVADPAVGTGTFLLGVLRRIADTIESDQGAGAVPAAIEAAAYRLIGFELQFGPFAVAQVRLLAELHALTQSDRIPTLRLFITDTLGNPFVEEERIPQIMQAIGKSRQEANAVKRGEPITVVIGNPPYKEKAKGRGGWIEKGMIGRHSPMEWWVPPVTWGVSAHVKHLKNLYVYFWRWATWKVFGTGLNASTGLEDVDRSGIICFITMAGFLNGDAFQRMRDDLRRSCQAIWVIDCSPDGHQPEVPTRIFQGVQQPVCIVIAARKLGKDAQTPARVRFRALPAGARAEKFAALGVLSLDDIGWTECPSSWRAPFLPASRAAWAGFPALDELFIYNGSGVMPGRTWVIAPDEESLRRRWDALIAERNPSRQEELFHPHQNGDKTTTKPTAKGLAGHEQRLGSVSTDRHPCIAPARYAYRSFDLQWIIPDNRLINRPNPALWDAYSASQVFITAPEDRTPSAGPAVTFSSLIPDLHHYHGRGGRVFPLWADGLATQPNLKPNLLTYLSLAYGRPVSASDFMSYLAAVIAHPAFTSTFATDLLRPGIRVPLTADGGVFAHAVTIGSEVIWLQTYGERYVDASTGRQNRAPRMNPEVAPRIPAGGAIPGAPEPLPDSIDYDPTTRRLIIGRGFVENVTQAMWDYEVSGKHVIRQWFSYRRLDRSRPIIGDRRPPSPLERIQPQNWLAEYTTDLINLLNVLGRLIDLEPRQATLLDEILKGDLIDLDKLTEAGALELPANAAGAPAAAGDARQGSLLD